MTEFQFWCENSSLALLGFSLKWRQIRDTGSLISLHTVYRALRRVSTGDCINKRLFRFIALVFDFTRFVRRNVKSACHGFSGESYLKFCDLVWNNFRTACCKVSQRVLVALFDVNHFSFFKLFSSEVSPHYSRKQHY